MKTIHFLVCGTGCRGKSMASHNISSFDDVIIEAVCDPYLDKAEGLADKLVEKGYKRPEVFGDYKKMLTDMKASGKADAVFIATSWCAHCEVAIFAMELGIAVALEVGGAYSEKDCRDLVETWERTKTPFMLMENCCFDKKELMATAMVRDGRFGRIVYCHGAYAHDLREEISYGDINRHYRLSEYTERNRENYPTHELGPIAKILNINRGNRMVSLTAMSSGSFGLHEYVQDKPELEYLRDREFAQGDVFETLIKCENGELISLKLDTTMPRFYSRELTIRGTKGLYSQENNLVYLDGMPENFIVTEFMKENIDNAKEYYEKYLPKIWKEADADTLKKGHGGMDYFEFDAFFDALRNGKEMPIDVYDAASWMSIAYLSEISAKNGGAPVEIPDFTNGKYKTREPRDVIELN